MSIGAANKTLILSPTGTQPLFISGDRVQALTGNNLGVEQARKIGESASEVLRDRGLLQDPQLALGPLALPPSSGRVDLRRVFVPFVANGFTSASLLLIHELTQRGVTPETAVGAGMLSFFGFAGLLYLMREKPSEVAGREIPHDLPTLGSLIVTDPLLQKAMATLTEVLKKERKMLQYFGLNPDTITQKELVELMSHLKVVAGKPEAGMSFVKAAYDFVHGILYLGDDHLAAVHECSHALHHVALARKLAFEDIRLVHAVFSEVMPPEDQDEHAVFVAEVGSFVEAGDSSTPIPQEIRLKTATLAFAMGVRQNLAGIESIGTRFHFAVGGFKQLLSDIVGNYVQWPFFGPITLLSGDYQRARLNAVLGYSNPLVYWYFRSQGLVEAVLPLERRSRPTSWLGSVLRSALEFHDDERSGFSWGA